MGQGRPRANKCDGCRRRHLKCDLLQPTCKPCLRHGFSCERSLDSMFVPYWPKKNNKTSSQDSEYAWPRKTSAPQSSTALAPVTGESLWFAHLYAMVSSGTESVLETWIGFRATSYEADSLARESFVALACSFFGRSKNSLDLLQWGNSQYLHCLRKVNIQLDDRETRTSPQALLTVAILGYYEALLLTAPSAWVRHYTGLAQLMQMAGPEACKDGVVFDTLRQSRFMMILAAMATQSDTFLSTPEWKTVPWEIQNAPKGSMHEMLDTVADLPGLKTGVQSESAENSRAILRRLDEWRSTWNDSMDSDLGLSDSSGPDYPSTRQGPITSSNLLTANCFCIYNAAVIMAAGHALRTSRAKDLQPGDASVLFHQMHEAAVGICRALDYHFQSSAGTSGGLFILWPLRMAAKVLRGGSPQEKLWLEKRMGTVMQSKGVWDIRREVFHEFHGT
ncbi:hypothetical protein M409DRAFT_53542 [Zasmidium cellare ATCC 36951]|uniref:Zn(2)-C6 fungal-type domain-containing protein n=1 Tax=Zasmidium cellare ATCC 36951 TaxID=1080233 RepID=A0A6A6CR05_ZASCE|nr:uncharacterized protein M409DRAFT_53542 [Zasmidium cellare ATCC 36951]KAF2168252.1 hypothetical protein M409DRAFT_53542 [Zasmidium cellare ATCC 36951]